MTSHHDVAGVVAREEALTDFIYEIHNYADAKEKAALLFAHLEAERQNQAKALSEWKQAASVEAGLRREFYDRAIAAEARLAEAMRVIEPFLYAPITDSGQIIGLQREHFEAARAFTNAAKKESKDA